MSRSPASSASPTLRTNSGRISTAEEFHEPARTDHPFDPVQLTRLDEALTLASRETGLRFSVYLGGLGDAPAERAAVTSERRSSSRLNSEPTR